MKRNCILSLCVLCAILLSLAHSVSALAQTSYGYKDLGPSGYDSFAYRVNDLGQAVGRVNILNGANAVLWLPAPAYGLPAGMNILIPSTGNYDNNVAWGINNSGEVVGDGAYPFLWLPAARYGLNAGLNNLNTVLSQIGVSNILLFPKQINHNHLIIGQARNLLDSTYHGFVLDLNTLTFTDLGTSLAESHGINNNSAPQVVGASWMYSFFDNTFTSLSPLQGATGINNVGEIIGFLNISGKNHPAYLSPSGQITDLGSYGGMADAINNAGTNPASVVGYVITAKGNGYAFRWRVGASAVENLNNLALLPNGYSLSEATSISDTGYIVGYGYGVAGKGKTAQSYYHAFLLTPQ